MLIFIINDGTSGQSACDCGRRRWLWGEEQQHQIWVLRDSVGGALWQMKQKPSTRASQQISIDTHRIDVGHDDKVRKKYMSGGWMGELSQRNGYMLLNVGCTEADGSFMETQSFGIRAVNLHVDRRELRDCLCIILQYFLEQTFLAQIRGLSTFLCTCTRILFFSWISWIPLRPLLCCSSLFLFFKPEHDLVMFWIRIHMYNTAQKSSLTNHSCWAQCVGNWAVLLLRVLSTVEMDVLMDGRGWRTWSVFSLCAEESLYKSANGGKK